MKTKIILVGPFLTRSGYGEQARFAIRALRSREDIFDIYLQPISWGHTSWISEDDDERAWFDRRVEQTIGFMQAGGQFDVSVQCTIPNEWRHVAPINIGYTAGIETTKVAPEWLTAANNMDRLIVVSNHSKNVFENTTHTGRRESTGELVEVRLEADISAVNYPVKNYEELPEVDLGLSTKFNFLSVAQFGPRKNIENTIVWFLQEFKDNEDVGMIVKTNKAKNCLMDREWCEGHLGALKKRVPNAKCKLYLLHGDMSDAEMHALYSSEEISAFVAIPHGEGFGLPIFEAAYSGLPVVATGWSGQLDFLVDEKGKDQFYNVNFDIGTVQPEVVWDQVLIAESGWAYARENSYKSKLRQCYDDVTGGNNSNATEYANELKERFSEEKMYKLFVDSLGLDVDSNWTQQLSEIEII